jgi:alpha-glucosidase
LSKNLKARVGDYIITARRKGNDWFIAGMGDWTPREFDVSLNFISAGSYKAQLCSDGINADNYPSDYTITNSTVKKDDVIKIKMAPGGGFVLKLIKEN